MYLKTRSISVIAAISDGESQSRSQFTFDIPHQQGNIIVHLLHPIGMSHDVNIQLRIETVNSLR